MSQVIDLMLTYQHHDELRAKQNDYIFSLTKWKCNTNSNPTDISLL